MAARADAELVRRGLARSRRQAAELVAAGRVSVEGRPVVKPSQPVPDDAAVHVQADPADPGYASRAALKLAGALDALAAHDAAHVVAPGDEALAPAVDGAWCLDLGASTGGFTDVLLRRGAAHVVAVDVGHDQLVPALRADPRVTVVEGCNVRDLRPEDLERAPDVVVADLSFISLTTVLPAVAGVVRPGTDLLLMVKPQFEVGRERLGSGGVVRDPALHREAVTGVVETAARLGLVPRAVVPSPLPGPSGNREHFVVLRSAGTGPVPLDPPTLDAAVRAAVAWQPEDRGPGAAPATPPVAGVAPGTVRSAGTPGGTGTPGATGTPGRTRTPSDADAAGAPAARRGEP